MTDEPYELHIEAYITIGDSAAAPAAAPITIEYSNKTLTVTNTTMLDSYVTVDSGAGVVTIGRTKGAYTSFGMLIAHIKNLYLKRVRE